MQIIYIISLEILITSYCRILDTDKYSYLFRKTKWLVSWPLKSMWIVKHARDSDEDQRLIRAGCLEREGGGGNMGTVQCMLSVIT